ncbi:MAG: transposase [Gaiellaceae bacterium]
MARPLRVFIPDGIYHVATRGSDRRLLFGRDQDRELFLKQLERIVESFQLPCLAYCLMGNHYHLILQTPDARLSAALKELNGGYSKQFNRIHGRSAHLFRNRFLAQSIESDSHLVTACRYLAYNPIRAGLCSRPSGWRWGSYRATAGIDPSPSSFLSEAMLRGLFGGDEAWRNRFREFVESSLPVEPPPGHKELRF